MDVYRKKGIHTENCYEDRLPKEILKFKKVGLVFHGRLFNKSPLSKMN
jgi:hypothetical protein